MNLFCKHDWTVILERTTESKFEHEVKVARSSLGQATLYCGAGDSDRFHIVILTCKNCGKLKRYVSEI